MNNTPSRDSGVQPDLNGDSDQVSNDDGVSSDRQDDSAMNSAEQAAAERLSKATALLAPYIPVFRSDPLAKIDLKAKDIDRQVLNYNRRFKSWKDMIVIPELPNKTWFGVWKSGLNDDALNVLEKLTYQANEDQEDYETVAKKLLEYLTNKRGSKYTARVQFRSLKQADKEQFSAFLQRLRSAAAPCRWPEAVKNENMIEQLIAGHKDECVRAILFDLDTDDLDKYIKKCEALEIASLQAAQIVQPGASTSHSSIPTPFVETRTTGATFVEEGSSSVAEGSFAAGISTWVPTGSVAGAVA
jgi:hypothetical protein